MEPGKDIEIKFTGLKQGEKLDEELMEDAAGFTVSEHPDIFILRGENRPAPGLDAHLLELELATRQGRRGGGAALERARTHLPSGCGAHADAGARPASPEA